MYYLNKIVGAIVNPIVVALILLIIGIVLCARGRKHLALGFVGGGVLWLWLWSTPMMYRWVGLGLEREWPVVLAEDAPRADAVVILGGGMGVNTNFCNYAEMGGAADRVWHAARLWKVGKAPIVITSGTIERDASVPLLRDFGVPETAIVVEDKARNTEENAKFVEEVLNRGEEGNGERGTGNGGRGERVERVEGEGESKLPTANYQLPAKKKILLVTSAWHMRRSVLMFKKYAPNLEIIPAAADYEASVRMCREFSFGELLPAADYLSLNSGCFKEHIGYWGYRLFRR